MNHLANRLLDLALQQRLDKRALSIGANLHLVHFLRDHTHEDYRIKHDLMIIDGHALFYDYRYALAAVLGELGYCMFPVRLEP